jgi:hypothetical protein
VESGLLPLSQNTVTIPPFSTHTRRPANIPLHTLSSSSRPYNRDTSPLIDEPPEKSSRSSLSEDSDFSIWSGSDTGDLVDQLAESHDPLNIRLQESLDAELLPRGSSKHKTRGQKRARFHPDVDAHNEKVGIVRRKEDIEIPNPPPRRIPYGEKLLVRIMAPNDGPSRIHGLHGKKLLYTSHSWTEGAPLIGVQIFHNHLCIIRCISLRL